MILALLLAQLNGAPSTLNLNMQPVMVQDEGVRQGTVRAITVNCTGAGVTCTQSGSTWILTVTGGGGGGGAPTTATYITQTPDATLTNEQAMSLSASGIVVNTTGTGVLTIYTGATCSSSFIRALSATGSATCQSVNLASDVTGTLPQGNGGTGTGALTCTAGERLTSNGTSYSCSAVVTQAYTTVEDEGAALTQRSNVNFTGAGVTCVDSGGKTVCTISGGGGGGGNFLEQSIALTMDGAYFSQVVTGQTWVTGTSKVLCSVFGTTADGLTPEAIGVGGLVVTVSDLVASTGFTINVFSPNGLEGTVRVHCTGA